MICCCAASTSLIFTGAEGFHVLAQHVRAALGHAAQDVIAQLLARAFECDGEVLAVRFSEYFLEAEGIDQQQVFKNEHQVADGLGGFASCCST